MRINVICCLIPEEIQICIQGRCSNKRSFNNTTLLKNTTLLFLITMTMQIIITMTTKAEGGYSSPGTIHGWLHWHAKSTSHPFCDMLHDLMSDIVWATHTDEELRVELWRDFLFHPRRDAFNLWKAILSNMNGLHKFVLSFFLGG